jgi:transcriptional regulator with XRE-family HTH domain
MKEINIAKVLVNKRKEKGITQEELASYMGVSKASISKWETGQSYPDVTFLPQLAAYFNISIDDLMDYKPQMKKEDIRMLYRSLSTDFVSRPFDTTMEDCRQIIKKYYSCFPLLLQMGILMLNHAQLLKDSKKSISLLEEAKALFNRVREESDDMSLTKQALYVEALCCLAIGDPNAALTLLDGMIAPVMPPESLLASAYQMTGRIDDAKAVLQVGIYQDIVTLFNFFPAYLLLCVDTPSKFNETLRRALVIAEAVDLNHLHPGVIIGTYIAAAQGYLTQGNHDKALDMLQQYTDLVTSDIYPMRLQGDAFFDLLDSWLDQLDLGTDLPRDDKTIRQSMYDMLVQNPEFLVLSEEQRFQKLTERLQRNCRDI